MGSLRYIQASDLHGTEYVKSVINTANSLDNIDAVFLLGDLLDRKVGPGPADYQYIRIIQDGISKIEEAQQNLGNRLVDELSPQLVRAVAINNEVLRHGGIEQIRYIEPHVEEDQARKYLRQLINDYDNSTDDRAAAEQRIDELERGSAFGQQEKEMTEMIESLESKMHTAINTTQADEAEELDRIFSHSKHPVYVGDGNHDGQALRNLNNAENLGFRNTPLIINGVNIAFEPNTREAIVSGLPTTFYHGLHSMTTDHTTEMYQENVKKILEQTGSYDDVAAFRSRYLSRNHTYNRLHNMDVIDILFLHNPVGQNAITKGRDRKFIDYSYAVGEIIREKKPTVLGWGHLHGKQGSLSVSDVTFGYPYQGVHSTDHRFFAVDYDNDQRKIQKIQVFNLDRPKF
jgi:Icc-related predicted phosphoesterase